MNKKTKKIAIILITSTISISLVLLLILNVKVEKIEDGNVYNEIIPEEEITDNQLRETTIYLYYLGEDNEIKEVVKKIDSKLLIENPYEKAIKELLNKENMGNFKSAIPDETTVNSVIKNGECVVVDLSKSFVKNMREDGKMKEFAIKQIVKTLTQFTEINAVKIIIDGSDEDNFAQLYTNEN